MAMRIQIGLQQKQAIDWLERSYQTKETGVICNIKVDPLLDPLRDNPCVSKIADRVVPPELN